MKRVNASSWRGRLRSSWNGREKTEWEQREWTMTWQCWRQHAAFPRCQMEMECKHIQVCTLHTLLKSSKNNVGCFPTFTINYNENKAQKKITQSCKIWNIIAKLWEHVQNTGHSSLQVFCSAFKNQQSPKPLHTFKHKFDISKVSVGLEYNQNKVACQIPI